MPPKPISVTKYKFCQEEAKHELLCQTATHRKINLGLEVNIKIKKFFHVLKHIAHRTLKTNIEILSLKHETQTTPYVPSNIHARLA